MDLRMPGIAAHNVARIKRRLTRPIVLVGMMGVGKTTVGRRLAALLDTAFVDADEEIEQSAQLTVSEIFETYGEDYFRDGERRVIARLMEEGGAASVIATGGGAFCQPETQALIMEKGLPVWLDSDIETLVERTARKNNRPLLAEGDARATLKRLFEARRADYAKAPIRVESRRGPHSDTVEDILESIVAWL